MFCSSFRQVLLVSSLMFGVALTAQAREFMSADIHPDTYPTVKAVAYMDELVNKASNGADRIHVYSQGKLGPEDEVLNSVRLGALDMARLNISMFHKVIPESLVPSMPFLFRNEAHMRKVLDGPIGDEILAAFEKKGFIALAFYDSGSRSMYGTQPFRSVADFKGKRIRVMQSDLPVAMIRALGAEPIQMSLSEAMTGFQSGFLAGAENNYSSYETAKHYQVAKYYSLTQHSMTPEVLVFSKIRWNTLTKAQQTMLRKAAKDSVPYMRRLWDEQQARSRLTVEKAGAQIITDVDLASFHKAVQPLYERFLTDAHLRDMVKRVQAVN